MERGRNSSRRRGRAGPRSKQKQKQKQNEVQGDAEVHEETQSKRRDSLGSSAAAKDEGELALRVLTGGTGRLIHRFADERNVSIVCKELRRELAGWHVDLADSAPQDVQWYVDNLLRFGDTSELPRLYNLNGISLKAVDGSELAKLNNCLLENGRVGENSIKSLSVLVGQRVTGFDMSEDKVQAFRSLEFLRVVDPQSASSLNMANVSQLARLSRLELKGVALGNIRPLAALQSLTELIICNPALGDEAINLEGLQDCKSLESLTIAAVDLVLELPSLAALPQLREIRLHEFRELVNLDFVAGCSHLTLFAIGFCNLASLGRGLDASAGTLKRLMIRGCQMMMAMPELGSLTALEELLIRSPITAPTIEALALLTNLRVLDLKEAIQSSDRFLVMSKVALLPNLEALYLDLPSPIEEGYSREHIETILRNEGKPMYETIVAESALAAKAPRPDTSLGLVFETRMAKLAAALTSCQRLVEVRLDGFFPDAAPLFRFWSEQGVFSLDQRPRIDGLPCTRVVSIGHNRMTSLEGIDALFPNCETLKIEVCPELVDVDALARLPQLQILYVIEVPSLVKLPALGAACPRLRVVSLEQIGLVKSLRFVHGASNLRILLVSCDDSKHGSTLDATALTTLPRLKRLSLSNFSKLAAFDKHIAKCAELVSLKFTACMHVGGLFKLSPELLPKLENLSFINTLGSASIVPIANAPRVERLTIRESDNLRTLRNSGHVLVNLVELAIMRCPQLTNIEALSASSKLRKLRVAVCDRLVSLNGLQACTATLELACFDNCPRLNNIDALRGCAVLKTVTFSFCSSLTKINALSACPALHSVSLRACDSVRSLAPLAGLRSLCDLDIVGLPLNIHGLRGLSGLTSLLITDQAESDEEEDDVPLDALQRIAAIVHPIPFEEEAEVPIDPHEQQFQVDFCDGASQLTVSTANDDMSTYSAFEDEIEFLDSLVDFDEEEDDGMDFHEGFDPEDFGGVGFFDHAADEDGMDDDDDEDDMDDDEDDLD